MSVVAVVVYVREIPAFLLLKYFSDLPVAMCSDNRFSSFASKSTLLFNVMSDTINTKGLKSKETAKMAIKKKCDKIQSRLPIDP
jgi:hypothetical protein